VRVGKKYYRYYKRDYSGSGTRWLGGRSVAAVLRWGARWYGQVNQVFPCVCVCIVCVCVCVCVSATCITAVAASLPTSETGFPPTRGNHYHVFPTTRAAVVGIFFAAASSSSSSCSRDWKRRPSGTYYHYYDV